VHQQSLIAMPLARALSGSLFRDSRRAFDYPAFALGSEHDVGIRPGNISTIRRDVLDTDARMNKHLLAARSPAFLFNRAATICPSS
jgi:hypothetical protein